MTDFGQSISPKIFRDQTAHVVSRWELCQLLDNALRAVGMAPLRGMSFAGFPAELSATWLDTSATRQDLMWFYAFPDASTFMVNGVAYIPVIGLWFGFDPSSNPANGWTGNGFGFKLCVVAASNASRSTIRNLETQHINGTNYGFGGSYSDAITTFWVGQKGAYYYAPGVKPSPNAGYSGQTLDAVNNIQVSLSKAGLWIFAGSGIRKTDMGNKVAVGFAFMGGRVPGRALDPAQDTYLNSVCPVAALPLNGAWDASDPYWNSTDSAPQTWSIGFQYNSSLYTLNAVKFKVYAIENMEASIYPRFPTPPIASPFKVNGNSRHLLQHMIVVPYAVYGLTSPIYGPVDSSGASMCKWSDVFYFPGVASSDSTLPYGDHVDPDSSKTWFAFTYPRNSQTFAIDITGASVATNPVAQTLTEDIYLSFVNGVGGPFPKPVTITRSTPANWTTTTGQDELMGSVMYSFTPNTAAFDVTVAGALATSRFKLTFDARVRSANAQQPNDYGFLDVSYDGGATWTTVWTMADAGTNVGAPGYNYATYTVELAGALSSHVRFRFGATNPNYPGLVTLYVRNLHLKRYD